MSLHRELVIINVLGDLSTEPAAANCATPINPSLDMCSKAAISCSQLLLVVPRTGSFLNAPGKMNRHRRLWGHTARYKAQFEGLNHAAQAM